MKNHILLLLLVLFGITLQAQIPSGYYDDANNQSGDNLKIALHNIIKNHQVVSYAGLLDVFAYTDCDANQKIWDIYSNYHFALTANCGSYKKEGDCWNREHTWPQSWFNEKNGPKSDLFHVYPTDGYVNNRRSNYPYGEVNKPTYTSGNGSKLGPCVTSGYSGTVFEPIDEYKGDIARSYFYMSVRYYSEDSGWGSSGMTNKSEILPWAMTMLLRWSDEDPVSEKEIARNNAVYGYQGNRNPFIDHPEYARMIWDPNYIPATAFNITYATGLSHGSVSGPATASEGSTVSITATPNAGYQVSSYNVYKTGSPSTTVTVSSNGTFTMPGYAVTVSASFVQNTTQYHIALGTVNHGSISTSAQNALSGTNITLTATAATGYQLHSWYVFKTGDMNTTVAVSGNSFTMPAFDVTVMATFTQGNAGGNYVKVTSAPDDWSGEYLIVYEEGRKAFDGSLTFLDAANNNITVTITDNSITSTTTTDASSFTINKLGNNYSIKAASGYYIGQTSDANGLQTSQTEAYSNTISQNTSSIDIIAAGGAHLRFNNVTDNQRFRYYKSSTYTNQQPIQLYKKTGVSVTPTHTIHFDRNGGTGSMSDQTVNEFESTALSTNTFTRSGFVFDGWNTQANGTGTYYVDGATVKLLDDLTLYAQWEPLYNITVASVENGTISASATQAIEEQTITLTAQPNTGYELDHWTVTYGENNSVEVENNQFEMPASHVTVSASFVFVGQPFEQKYYLVTSTEQLVARRTYLIVNTSAQKALSKTQNGNNRAAAAVTITNNTITTLGDACELTLGGSTGAWNFYDATNNSGYLYAASSSNNYLKTQATNDDNGKWSIAITNNGAASITAQGSNTHNLLKYNTSNSIFSCYGESSTGVNLVELFIRSESIEPTSDTTIANLFDFDSYTINEGITLTVTGTATSTEPNHIVIEEGGQLIHHNDGVKATIKKGIEAYTDHGGWYTIATPFVSCDPTGTMVADDYDLYAYDEDGDDEGYEWINYKPSGSFSLTASQGYLYAHYPNTNLRMTGALANGDYSKTVNLSYDNDNADIRGYNLLGNPTAHEITFSKTDEVSDGYYYLSNSDSWEYATGNSVPVGRGFLVKANNTNQTVTLNTQSKGLENAIEQFICLQIDDDQAFVKTTEGVSMPLLSFHGRSSSICLNRDGRPYIMLVRDEANSLELNYQARQHGQHQLQVNTDGLELDYLHLVDRITGADIDLLATPNYTFESNPGDYSSRFLLQFTESGHNNDAFSDSAEGTIQILDMTGRMVGTNPDRLTPGVYVIRSVNGNEVKTKKIVIP